MLAETLAQRICHGKTKSWKSTASTANIQASSLLPAVGPGSFRRLAKPLGHQVVHLRAARRMRMMS
jgi:hypothetical protein